MISTAKGLGFVCVPKCGSTSIEHAIRPHCNIRLSGNPRIKHLTYIDAETFVFPMLQSKGFSRPHMFAVVRDPLDWLGSWYRYRSRDALKGSSSYAGDQSLSGFIRSCCSNQPPVYARIKDQSRFLLDSNGQIAVDTILPYESLREALPSFLDQFGIKMEEVPRKNVSPLTTSQEDEVDQTLVELVRTTFAKDYEIYYSAASAAPQGRYIAAD